MFSLVKVFLLVILGQVCLVHSQYQIPEVTLEAFSPSGFRASIRADPGVEFFVFHGNVNKKIAATEPGEIGGEIRVNSSNVGEYVTYSQPTLKLKKGDIIYYWVYVQQDLLGYRKDGQQWEVTELRSQSGNECKASTSQITGRTDICSESVVFEENFDQSNIDTTKWLVEQYIPDGPDYEFVVYKKDNDVAFLTGNSLAVKPKLQDQKELTKETLDISNGCTRQGESCKRTLFVRHNPVISGRLVSHTMFRYGEFEIKAKLPTGDWMYPEIYLEGDNDQKLFIAYARGNEELTSKEGINIGAGLLYGGPALHPTEPRRSEKLSSHRGNGLFTADFHIYKVVWTPSKYPSKDSNTTDSVYTLHLVPVTSNSSNFTQSYANVTDNLNQEPSISDNLNQESSISDVRACKVGLENNENSKDVSTDDTDNFVNIDPRFSNVLDSDNNCTEDQVYKVHNSSSTSHFHPFKIIWNHTDKSEEPVYTLHLSPFSSVFKHFNREDLKKSVHISDFSAYKVVLNLSKNSRKNFLKNAYRVIWNTTKKSNEPDLNRIYTLHLESFDYNFKHSNKDYIKNNLYPLHSEPFTSDYQSYKLVQSYSNYLNSAHKVTWNFNKRSSQHPDLVYTLHLSSFSSDFQESNKDFLKNSIYSNQSHQNSNESNNDYLKNAQQVAWNLNKNSNRDDPVYISQLAPFSSEFQDTNKDFLKESLYKSKYDPSKVVISLGHNSNNDYLNDAYKVTWNSCQTGLDDGSYTLHLEPFNSEFQNANDCIKDSIHTLNSPPSISNSAHLNEDHVTVATNTSHVAPSSDLHKYNIVYGSDENINSSPQDYLKHTYRIFSKPSKSSSNGDYSQDGIHTLHLAPVTSGVHNANKTVYTVHLSSDT